MVVRLLSALYWPKRVGGNSRLLRGLQYVMEGLLAALLDLVDDDSDEGRRQLPAYRVRRAKSSVVRERTSFPYVFR